MTPLQFDEWLEREIEKLELADKYNSLTEYGDGWLDALRRVKRELENPEQQQSNNKETST